MTALAGQMPLALVCLIANETVSCVELRIIYAQNIRDFKCECFRKGVIKILVGSSN